MQYVTVFKDSGGPYCNSNATVIYAANLIFIWW